MTQDLSLIINKPFEPNRKAVAGFLGLAVMTMSLVTYVNFRPVQAAEHPSSNESTLILLTNNERIANGLKPLKYNADLHEAAQRKAYDMLVNGYFEHVSPDGKTPWSFIEKAGYDYRKAGENLAIDFTTVEGPVPAWMASPTHRANILKKDYKEVGIAQVKGTFNDRETTVVVQMFGTK